MLGFGASYQTRGCRPPFPFERAAHVAGCHPNARVISDSLHLSGIQLGVDIERRRIPIILSKPHRRANAKSGLTIGFEVQIFFAGKGGHFGLLAFYSTGIMPRSDSRLEREWHSRCSLFDAATIRGRDNS